MSILKFQNTPMNELAFELHSQGLIARPAMYATRPFIDYGNLKLSIELNHRYPVTGGKTDITSVAEDVRVLVDCSDSS